MHLSGKYKSKCQWLMIAVKLQLLLSSCFLFLYFLMVIFLKRMCGWGSGYTVRGMLRTGGPWCIITLTSTYRKSRTSISNTLFWTISSLAETCRMRFSCLLLRSSREYTIELSKRVIYPRPRSDGAPPSRAIAHGGRGDGERGRWRRSSSRRRPSARWRPMFFLTLILTFG